MQQILTPARVKCLNWEMIITYMEFCHAFGTPLKQKFAHISKSTLFNRLSCLEQSTKINLFDKTRGRLMVNEQGLFVAKYLLRMLLLEQFARHTTLTRLEQLQWIELEIPLRYYGGKISQALEYALTEMLRQNPNLLIWPRFIEAETEEKPTALWSPPIAKKIATISGYWEESPAENQGQWYVLSPTAYALDPQLQVSQLQKIKLQIPLMPWKLLQLLSFHTDKLHLSLASLGMDYRRLMDQEKSIIINSQLLNQNQIPKGWKTSVLTDLPPCTIHFHQENSTPEGEQFIQFFNAGLKEFSQVTWQCQTKLNAWYYLKLIYESRNISHAAQQAMVTQSAISANLANLENELKQKIMERKSGQRSLTATPFGKLIYHLARGICSNLSQLFNYTESLRLNQKQTLTLGILPSIDSASNIIKFVNNKIIQEWWSQNPNVKIEILEERHHNLVELLRHHKLHFALLEADSPWVKQVSIKQTEPIGLIIHQDLIDPAIKQLSWHQLDQFKLVLNRKPNGIRTIIEQHCLNLGVQLNLFIESDSLNLNQHLVVHQSFATILPHSSLAQAIENQALRFIPLEPQLNRELKFAYLGNRILSPLEFNFVNYLASIKQS